MLLPSTLCCKLDPFGRCIYEDISSKSRVPIISLCQCEQKELILQQIVAALPIYLFFLPGRVLTSLTATSTAARCSARDSLSYCPKLLFAHAFPGRCRLYGLRGLAVAEVP